MSEASTPPNVLSRLCGMMFLQYFIQGSYLPIISVYAREALKFTDAQLGGFSAALAVGPLLAPFVLGQLVDRHYATQKVLAFCHFAAGLVMLVLYRQTEFWPVVTLGVAYSVLYVPTMMLTNSLAFHHLRNRDREFPKVRVLGTIGFIVPAWLVEFYWLSGLSGEELNQARGIVFALAGAAGVVMGLYCLLLPNTPPDRRPDRPFAPGVVATLLKQRNFLVLVLVSFPVAIVHQFFWVWNGPLLTSILRAGGVKGAWEQRISSLCQVSEIAVMALVSAFILRVGFKRTMLLGLAAYLLRCVLLAAAGANEGSFATAMTLACLGQMLHGVCFGCFLAVAFMYLDRESPSDVRGSVQNLYGTLVLGLGFFLAGFVAGQTGQWFETSVDGVTGHDWPGLWLACAGLAAACFVAFAVWFPRDAKAIKEY